MTKPRYAYHFQDGAGVLVFRYDNVAHYPAISTFPHHKHVGARTGDSQTVIATLPPSLTDVLQEIDAYLYGSQEP
ncbi:MAG: hypothetical protein IAE81_22335 [Caldilineaceae bacterium]|nr:hypothetical protein [Caldilineaceae bacterium]